MKKAFLSPLLVAFFAITGFSQVTSVRHEYIDSLPSRGATTIVEGSNFTDGWSDQAMDILSLPDNIRGVQVFLDGFPCRLRGVSPTRIAMVVPYDTPVVPPVRLRWNKLVVKAADGKEYPFRVYINDSSPWLVQLKDTQYPIGLVMSGNGFSFVYNGVINATAGGARVSLMGTGIYSNFAPEYQIYTIWLIDEEGNFYELPVDHLSRGTVVYGWDNVIFDIPGELATQLSGKNLELVFQTPSAFSQNVKVKIVVQ